jgi:hypothetical protein
VTRRKRRESELDEPTPAEEDVMFGIVAVGTTEAGFPFGLTLEEWRATSEQWARGAGWARAKSAIRELAERQNPGSRVEVGWVRFLGEGAFRRAWIAALDIAPDPFGFGGRVVAAVPREPMEVGDEVRWLARLARRALPFAIPRPLGATPDGIVVTSFVPGLAAPRDAWRQCVRVAAALHREPFSFDGDRSAHAERRLADLRERTHPDVVQAVAWCDRHLPQGPLVLTHGDLRPQNLLVLLGGELGVVDWQSAGPGDPAEELAVLTRGAGKPFRVAGGLSTILRAYLDAGGVAVTADEVVFYELCALARAVTGSGFEHHVATLRAVLRRATTAA